MPLLIRNCTQIIIPMTLWLWDFAAYRKGSLVQKLQWAFHVLMILIGALYVYLTPVIPFCLKL